MLLKEKLQSDLNEALKAKIQPAIDALRMLKAAMMKFEVAGKEKIEASDEQILSIVQKEIKSRQESFELFEKGNRPELAAKEKSEIEVLKKYLPPQMSEEDLRAVIKTVITEVDAKGKTDMGKVMGALMPKVKGKTDGGTVNRIVSELLS